MVRPLDGLVVGVAHPLDVAVRGQLGDHLLRWLVRLRDRRLGTGGVMIASLGCEGVGRAGLRGADGRRVSFERACLRRAGVGRAGLRSRLCSRLARGLRTNADRIVLVLVVRLRMAARTGRRAKVDDLLLAVLVALVAGEEGVDGAQNHPEEEQSANGAAYDRQQLVGRHVLAIRG